MILPRSFTTACSFVLVACLVVGCGEAKLSDVSGTVTYDGQAVERGSISFIPVDGNGPSGGAPIENGKYTATRVHTGMTKVTISGVKVTGKKKMYDDPNSPEVITSAEYIPDKYNKMTELRYEVQPGSQVKDFELAK
jgi:hypothetical protein